MEEINIAAGFVLPFFPMRPTRGRNLDKKLVMELLEGAEDFKWVLQPKLNGDRAILAIKDKKVYVQSRYCKRMTQAVYNSDDFLKLDNNTIFDGEVWKGNFYPFEVLVLAGRSFRFTSVEEREVMAFQMVRFLGHEWAYRRPTKKWLLAMDKNLPKYEGVVRKDWKAAYLALGKATQESPTWFKHLWG